MRLYNECITNKYMSVSKVNTSAFKGSGHSCTMLSLRPVLKQITFVEKDEGFSLHQ